MRLWQSFKECLRQVYITPSFSMHKALYDDYWKKRRGLALGSINEYQLDRVEWIEKHIQPGEAVLDLGCGDGAVLLELYSKILIDATGADISDYALGNLRNHGIKTLRCSFDDHKLIEELPEVDHILLLEVLEHMAHPEEFLMSLLAKARKSVIFSFPNTGYISYRLRLLRGYFPVQWCAHPSEHLRYWTYKDLLWWVRQLGLNKYAAVDAYQGIPGINKLHPGLFGAALICKIDARLWKMETTICD